MSANFNSSAITTCLLVGLGLVPARAAHAEAWKWLRSENKHVREGNEKLAAGDGKAALAAYDRAARELPSEGGVHLDRGLALMKTGDTAGARNALQLATRPPASAEVRADAYYNLGVGFYQEADAHAGKDEHQEAQKLFREAADAFKQSLRLRPGDRNTAWNYELGARRIREQQEKQKQEEEQDKQKQQKKDEQDKQDQPKDGDQQPQSSGDKQDPQKQNKPDDKQAQQDKQKQKQEQQKQEQAKKDETKKEQAGPQPEQPKPEPLRPDVAQALDALQDGEQNLERLRALQRASSERRAPEKDW